MLTKDALRVQVNHWGADLWILAGKRGSGKSTLGNYLLMRFVDDYVIPKNARILIMDTKPHFMPELDADGMKLPKKTYKQRPNGEPLKGFRRVRNMKEYLKALQTGGKCFVFQNEDLPQNVLIKTGVDMMEHFWRTQYAETPGLIYIDETMDFFGTTGVGKHGDVIQRICRAGREKSLAAVLASQRPKSINIQTMSEANCAAIFAIKYKDDQRRIYDMILPRGVKIPTLKKEFVLMRDDEIVSLRTRLKI